jgi:hypothetical protein
VAEGAEICCLKTGEDFSLLKSCPTGLHRERRQCGPKTHRERQSQRDRDREREGEGEGEGERGIEIYTATT